MIYKSSQNREDYFTPLFGNGEIALAPDCEGCLNYTFDENNKTRNVAGFNGIIVRSCR